MGLKYFLRTMDVWINLTVENESTIFGTFFWMGLPFHFGIFDKT
jgi:hypothetical protein